MMRSREFANIIVHDYGSKVFSLCRINVLEHLFYPEIAAAQEASAAEVATPNKKELLSTMSSCEILGNQHVNFSKPSKMADATNMHFFSLLKGQAEGSVVFVDPYYDTVIYDIDMESVSAISRANFCKQSDSISLSMTGRIYGEDYQQLYVMDKGKDDDLFEVLNYRRTGLPRDTSAEIERWWHWKPLPSPPLYGPQASSGSGSEVFPPSAAAVVDDTTICVSSVDSGAACAFDTVKSEWRQAGNWVLPCHGAAEYVPELGLWFGVEHAIGNPQHSLRAFHLSSSSQPVVQGTWNYLDRLPDEWLTWQRHLVNLGAGKFCIATSFQSIERPPTPIYYRSYDWQDDDGLDDDIVINDLTVLTGVEVVRSSKGLQMVNHKSKRCTFHEGIGIHCVL